MTHVTSDHENTVHNYKIVVSGAIPESWLDRMGEMRCTTISSLSAHQQRTTLQGAVKDQAELNGILQSLYDLQLPIVSVCRVKDTQSR